MLFSRAWILGVALLLVCGSSALGQSDECDSATPVVEGSYPFSNDTATFNGPEACDPNMDRDVWFLYTATVDGNVSIDTCTAGTLTDTVLIVYDASGGCPLIGDPGLACADDQCGPVGFSAALTVPVIAGQSYLLQVGGWDGAVGDAVLTIGFGEVCDDGVDNDGDGDIDCQDTDCASSPLCFGEICDDGVDNDGDGFIDCQDFDCAGDPACFESNCSDGVDNDGDGFVDCEDFDCTDSLECQEFGQCDDGIDNDGDGLVDCFDPDCVGDPICGVPIVPNDNCADAFAVGPGQTDFTNVGATLDGPIDCDGDLTGDVWFSYTSSSAGGVTISTCDTTGSLVDTTLIVYDGDVGCPVAPDPGLACADDNCGPSGFNSELAVDLAPGQTLLIQVGGWNGSQGDGTLTITPFEQCDDGTDNDLDGFVDCDDSDCADDPICLAPPTPSEFIRGADCNGDGNFNIGDSVTVLDLLFGTGDPVACADACDNNDDGAVDVADAVHGLSSLFEGGPPPAPPFPDCGADPTPDSLGCGSSSTCGDPDTGIPTDAFDDPLPIFSLIDLPLDLIDPATIESSSDPVLLETLRNAAIDATFGPEACSIYLGLVPGNDPAAQIVIDFDESDPTMAELLATDAVTADPSGIYSAIDLMIINLYDADDNIYRYDSVDPVIVDNHKNASSTGAGLKGGCCAILAVAHSLVRKMNIVPVGTATVDTDGDGTPDKWDADFLTKVYAAAEDGDTCRGLTDEEADTAHLADWNTLWNVEERVDESSIYDEGDNLSCAQIAARAAAIQASLDKGDDVTMRIRGKDGKKGDEWGHRVPIESVSYSAGPPCCLTITITRTSRQETDGTTDFDPIPYMPGTATYTVCRKADGSTEVTNTEFSSSTILLLSFDAFDEEPRNPSVQSTDTGEPGTALDGC